MEAKTNVTCEKVCSTLNKHANILNLYNSGDALVDSTHIVSKKRDRGETLRVISQVGVGKEHSSNCCNFYMWNNWMVEP